ncbi:Z1 domain-containing protein [Streptomyces luomodiensis]|uniref:Z1 domain-containing protein n=1 Tax=Streptomyces luomodiensis TaxID=3026192 RepID=A0ABY9UZH3_9ACTN|nr:Z1 domain-containing protein [Streptomyces sp. SCA4-21]WNE97913.1 Z1 domain-containing protein [Streptomyces sp. SCA4-21]
MSTAENLKADALLKVHQAALAGMQAVGPGPLGRAVAFYAEMQTLGQDVSETTFRELLTAGGDGAEALKRLWRVQLTDWDYATGPTTTDWASDTEPRTDERRTAIHDRLGLEPATRKVLDAEIPVQKTAGPVVISQERKPWRGIGTQRGIDWYWPAYQRYLQEKKGWSPETTADLGDAAERVVERLADPTSPETYQSKGLVVGYVQSGKTANFTGVIAKAIDAGYRLVIVLGGTLNLLRAQTQRRLDMELVGRENILRGTGNEIDSDYADDTAWLRNRFLTHGGMPSELGAFDVERLTTRANDYKSLAQGIRALQIEKRDKALPLYDPRNLDHAAARLMVVKKNKTVLNKLVKDLEKIKGLLGEIPALIIDDESDEASPNTANPKRSDGPDRTAINQKLSELLGLLPRAQYVGYTATPFANVFIDPSDTRDIFPKDFLISLRRPDGYMGVQDFHDLDSKIPPQQRTVANSNQKAYVREIGGSVEEEDDISLRKALDMFVLTGAMKIYREAVDPRVDENYFRHHTMLVHESRLTAEHSELRGRLLRLWDGGGYTGPSGRERLRDLFESDLLPVSRVRADGFAVPSSYDDLAPYVGPAWARIGADDRPVIVVNGDKDVEKGEADFDRRAIWKILIGGQKLSRGFTVEGLTVTYYRRRAGNASTMMQMGRWFGFRRGYRDLVRLWIGRKESSGGLRPHDIDLYDAFEAICRDEESFRAQLEQYSVMVNGKPQVTPAQVPPLVSQHFPKLKPTSRNKMYNARLAEVRTPGQWSEPTAYPAENQTAALRHNTDLWLPVLDQLSDTPTLFSFHNTDTGVTHGFDAFTGLLRSEEALSIFRSLKWHGQQFTPSLAYLETISENRRDVDDWLVIAPQHSSSGQRVPLGTRKRPLSWFSRKRRPERYPLFGAISDPKHRAVAMRIAGALANSNDPITEQHVASRRGVITLYPVLEQRPCPGASGEADLKGLVMAFSFVAPAAAHGPDNKVVRFTTIDSAQEDEAIIDTA